MAGGKSNFGYLQTGVRKISVKKDEICEEEEAMSPKGAIFRHHYKDSYILVIIGQEKQVDLPLLKATVQSTLVKHKRFSSIVKRCRNGNQKWVLQQEVEIDKHIIVPNLSNSFTQNPQFVEEYTASLATAPPLDPSRPLWQIHVLNYKSPEAAASVVFKIHHCIGDCVSLMSLFLDSTRKHSQPDSMPTIPCSNRVSKNKWSVWSPRGILQAMWSAIFSLWCTVVELLHALATLLCLKDSKILRGPPEVVDQPKRLAHVTLDLQDIAIVKKAVNGTVNDVITGMLSAGFVRYFNRLHEKDGSRSKKASDLRIRALVPVNTRPSPGLHPLEYMMEKNQRDARWGNGFSLWTLPIPLRTRDHFLDYCREAKGRLNRKKASFEAQFSYVLTALIARIFGINVAIHLPYRQCLNTTLVFSNVQGPVEQVQLHNNLVTHIITTVSRLPQGLVVHFQSYAGKAKLVAMAAEDIFPNPQQLCKDWAYALHQMKEEALALAGVGVELQNP
eukprot:PITA_26973